MKLVIDKRAPYEDKLRKGNAFFEAFLSMPFTSQQFLSVLTQTPSDVVPITLACAIRDLASSKPALLEPLLTKLKSLLESNEITNLKIPTQNGPEPFCSIFQLTLSEIISDYCHTYPGTTRKDTIFVPLDDGSSQVHPMLQSSFLVAAIRKVGFMQNWTWHYITLEGLQICDYEIPEGEDIQEVAAISAVVLFATLGAHQYATLMAYKPNRTYQCVLDALKGLREHGVIHYTPAVALLERVIDSVQNHDETERSTADIWTELFGPGTTVPSVSSEI
ncbi:hypothetical protein EST38_g2823 [Candolleomyces aberdarensis]|uniref:Uncharacterized protein n=1 Tax=Candolleomyces aberdarensis TaxID=2316362 RepID=A0A4Q2DRJ3_9AGAR|nr:hypothetical protein EST38_g2823 [Candolleomyces aberdarensis]